MIDVANQLRDTATELRTRVQVLPEEVLGSVRDAIQEIPDRNERLSASLILLSAMTVPADILSEPLDTDTAQRLSEVEIAAFREAEDDIAAGEAFFDLFDAIEAGDNERARATRERLTELGYFEELGQTDAIFVAEISSLN
jgi:hypothetical protein